MKSSYVFACAVVAASPFAGVLEAVAQTLPKATDTAATPSGITAGDEYGAAYRLEMLDVMRARDEEASERDFARLDEELMERIEKSRQTVVTSSGSTIGPNSQAQLTGPGGSTRIDTGSDTRVTVRRTAEGFRFEVAGSNAIFLPDVSTVPEARVQVGTETLVLSGPLEMMGRPGGAILLTSLNPVRPNGFVFDGRSNRFQTLTLGGWDKLKVTENESPQPRDRVFTDSFFPNVTGQVLKASADSLRGSGVEKTFLVGRPRTEVRLPFASSLQTQQLPNDSLRAADDFRWIGSLRPLLVSQLINDLVNDTSRREVVASAGVNSATGTGSIGTGTGATGTTGTGTAVSPPAPVIPPATVMPPPAAAPPTTGTGAAGASSTAGSTLQSASNVQFASSVSSFAVADPDFWDVTVLPGQRLEFVLRDRTTGQVTESITGNINEPASRNPSIVRLTDEASSSFGVPQMGLAPGVNSGRHIAFGAPVATGTFPASGTFTYNFVATTAPTYSNFGVTAPGTLTGSAVVDFASLRVGVGMTATMPDQTYTIQTPGGTANPGLSTVRIGTSAAGERFHSGIGRYTTNPGGCALGCETAITGHFYGAGAAFTSIVFRAATGNRNQQLNGAALGQR